MVVKEVKWHESEKNKMIFLPTTVEMYISNKR